MSVVTEITGTAALFLSVFNAARDVARQRRRGAGIFRPDQIADIHRHLDGLRRASIYLAEALASGDSTSVEKGWLSFSRELADLTERIAMLNLDVIEIYQPGLGRKLAYAYSIDPPIAEYRAYQKQSRTGPLRRLLPRTRVPRQLLSLHEKLCDLYMRGRLPQISKDPAVIIRQPQECIAQLRALDNALEQCATVVAEFLKSNWSPKDLT